MNVPRRSVIILKRCWSTTVVDQCFQYCAIPLTKGSRKKYSLRLYNRLITKFGDDVWLVHYSTGAYREDENIRYALKRLNGPVPKILIVSFDKNHSERLVQNCREFGVEPVVVLNNNIPGYRKIGKSWSLMFTGVVYAVAD